MEQCGVAPGTCDAPTPEDCADDDCDGQIDEGLSCLCRPEICNGMDDDCNGVVDDIPTTPCGLAVGICTPGTARWSQRDGRRQHGLHGRHRTRDRGLQRPGRQLQRHRRRRPRPGLLPDRVHGVHVQRHHGHVRLQGPVLAGQPDLHHGVVGEQRLRRRHHPDPRGPLRHAGQQLRRADRREQPGHRRPVLPGGHRGLHGQRHTFTCVGECKPGQRCATPPPGRSTA